jgi:hypothetical protein
VEKEVIGKLVGIMMMSRTYAHLCHLKTGSYSKHMALQGFYEEIVDLVDEIAETAQGKFGKLDLPFMDMKGSVDDPIGGLETQLQMVENLVKKCENRTLGAIADEITQLYISTLYKLKELN